jgi:hypothetical protein
MHGSTTWAYTVIAILAVLSLLLFVLATQASPA